MEKIYILTMVYLTETEKLSDDRFRTVGWFPTKDMAEKCVKENWADIWEVQYYNMAVVEEMGIGPHAFCKNAWWYSGKLIDEENQEYEVVAVDKPEKYKGLCNMGIG